MSTKNWRVSPAAMCIVLALVVLAGATIFSCTKKDKAHEKPEPVGDLYFDENLDFTALPDDYAEAMKEIRKAQPWSERNDGRKRNLPGDKAHPKEILELEMTREILLESFELGSDYLVRWQIEDGSFRYMYDWLDKTWVEDDNQVRQAGALWGVALCHQYRPTDKTRDALDKGLKFWFDSTIEGPQETLTVQYKQDAMTSSGTVALVALSIIEYLSTPGEEIEPEYKAELTSKLEGYLAFLQWMQLDNGQFSRDYRVKSKSKVDRSSPYYDGETLLCLCKACRVLGYDDLKPTIEEAARATAETYTIEAWPKDIDSKQTKGFYQWSSMSFVEYHKAQWKDYELFGDVTLTLGWWMTHTHETLRKGRNHAYAVEGLVSAYRIAEARDDREAMIDLLYTIDRSLTKLSSWQIGGPLAGNNDWLTKNPTDDPMTLGGVMNARKASGRPVASDVSHQLRIDVTQHQMHAVTMALETIYTE